MNAAKWDILSSKYSSFWDSLVHMLGKSYLNIFTNWVPSIKIHEHVEAILIHTHMAYRDTGTLPTQEYG